MTLRGQDTQRGKKPLVGSGGLLAGCCLSVLLALIVASCAYLEAKQMTTCTSQNNLEKKHHFPTGQQGSILLLEKGDQALPVEQVFVAAFQFTEEKIEPQELLVVPGSGNIPYSQKCDFQFELVDVEEKLLARYGIWNPRLLIADEGEKTGFVEVPTATFVARFPFSANAKEIRVIDATGKMVASIDVRSAIESFCTKQRNHPDCRPVKLK